MGFQVDRMRKFFVIISFMLFSIKGSCFSGGGKVSMNGTIVESACTISTNDLWQEVDFGEVPLSKVVENGEATATMKAMIIHLVNCNLEKNKGGSWNNVSITFDGDTDSHRPDMFAMRGKGRGIGVEITDANGNVAVPGKVMPSLPLQEENTNLDFTIHLKRNNDTLKAGSLSSYIRFMVAYQ
ncbi:type 1 fimbria pilin [Serratia fonticola]|jgi:type 1 fimbria pilin|uniref:Type 1 fimbria pilin n=1 Tax=Serratia fonticola TaxID=47917 RepID=A0A542BII7_SERFO|nr:fimbrial protein [Serratia fonticola]TQI78373.1 type 1 fimbria pilin [Serratia fonticola]TQI99605.1 type 1 fimbria pilin [Serratia fonticola]TVZ69128.1 type 1 fimbria pilin [Serratia fonticola]